MTPEFLMGVVQAGMAVVLFLGKLAMDDRDRRLTKLETFIAERVRMNDEKLAGIIHRIAETERQNARADEKLAAIKDTLERIERTMERLADRVDERPSQTTFPGVPTPPRR